jgi:hypothetical protein
LPVAHETYFNTYGISQAKSSEDNETIMDRELKSKSETKFKRMTDSCYFESQDR